MPPEIAPAPAPGEPAAGAPPPRVVLRIERRDRMARFLARAAVQAGATLYVFEGDVQRPSRDAEQAYFRPTEPPMGARAVDALTPELAAGATLVDSCMDGRRLELPWRQVIYHNARLLPTRFDPRVARYLVLVPGPERERARRLGWEVHAAPYGPHPSHPDLQGAWCPRPMAERRVHALFAGTPNVARRVRLMEQVRRELAPEPFLLPLRPGASPPSEGARRFVFCHGRLTDFAGWRPLLGDTRWVLDLPGFKPITHRVVEACLSGCALLLHRDSAAVYDPPFRDGVDALLYDETDLPAVIQRAMTAPLELAAELAARARRRLRHGLGIEAAGRTLARLLAASPAARERE